MRTPALALGLLATMTGCVTDADLGADEPEVVDGKGDGPAGSLAGSYALELTSIMKLEDDRESDPEARFSTFDLRARAIATVTQSGQAAQLSIDLCDVRLPTVSGYQPELDPALVVQLPPVAIAGTLAGGRLTTEPAAIVLGAALSDPVLDALPATTGDARLRDQDRDGNPGVSIRLSVGRIYAALRVVVAIDTPVGSTSTIEGAAELRLDQAILGDSIPFYDAAASLAESQPHIHVLSSANKVRMKRGATSCAQVQAAFP